MLEKKEVLIKVLSREEALKLSAVVLIIKRPDMHWMEEITAATISLRSCERCSVIGEV